MTWIAVGIAATTATVAGVKAIQSNQEKKKADEEIKKLEANRPKYAINPEAFENVEIAKRQAFGEQNEIVSARTALDQDASDVMAESSKVSDSGTSILAIMEAMNANKMDANVDLAQVEAGIMTQRLGDLYRNKFALIDEKDKAFEYNLAAPYADKLSYQRRIRTQAQENEMRALDSAAASGSTAGSTAGSSFG